MDVRGGKARFTLDGEAEPIRICGKEYSVGREGIEVERTDCPI